MSTYIDHLRKQPESHKRKVALTTSASITALIAIVWVTSFSYFNGGASNVEVAKRNTENSPMNVIKRNIAGAYESLTGSQVEFVKEEDATSTPTLEYVPTPESSLN